MLVAFNDSTNIKKKDEYGHILTRFRRLWKEIVNENPELKKIMKRREKGYEDSLRHFIATQRRKNFLEERRKKARRSTVRGETARRNRISQRTKILTDDDGVEFSPKYNVSAKDGWKKYIRTMAKSCGRKGVTVGGSPDFVKKTIDFTVNFFTKSL